ncbi:TonB-dependent receptor [Phenylobacterium sp.]|uniref:TonB-dependent receptor n=1 Tax=Phenylobacterium sp. TaxID=1871053 RepID=UPI0035B073B3
MLLKRQLLAATALAGVSLAATHAFAQDTNLIEELVVTAEKREQSLQDVPVAVSAFTDERRETIGINSVQDLTNFTPGLAYATNNDRIAMRGIGRFTNNRSSEGGVAMYNDGVYTSSVTAFARSTLFIERTEALRGPQGTLYGRNSIGGALNIISKRPTDDFYAEVRGGVGNYDSWFTEGAISGPLVGNIRGRLAGSYSSQGEGYFKNLNPNGKDEGGIGDQWQIEGQLDGSLADEKFEWFLKVDTAEWHNLGRGPGGRTTATYGIRDVTSPFQATLTPNAATFGLPIATPGSQCQFCFDSDDGNYISLENNGYNFQATLHLDSFDVKYIGGYNYYDYRLQTDLDGTSRSTPFLLPLPASAAPLPLPAQNLLYYPRRNNQYQEEVWWFSNELNLASTYEGPVQFILGLYQFREGSNYTLSNASYVDDPRFERPTNQSGVSVAPNPGRQYGYGSSSNVSESYATFGQVDWQATDEFKVTAGLRYTYDRKRSFESARLMCFYSATSCPVSRVTGRPVDITDAAAPGYTVENGRRVYDPAVYLLPYTDATTGLRHRGLKYDWSGITGTLGVDWQPDPDTLAYAKYTRGYKAGGFNSGTTTLTPSVTTQEETIDAYEVGYKRTFGGKLQANLSAFLYNYQDIQIPITGRNPDTGLNVTQFYNMPKARIVGFEAETIWQPIDHLQILANYSYLNAELREACCFLDPDDPLGSAPSRAQDLKGATLPSSTPHRVTVNANYTWMLGAGDLTASATYVWRDDTYYSIFNEYYNRAKAWEQVDARLIFNDADDRFTAIAWVKNLFKAEGVTGIDGERIDTGPNGLGRPGGAFVNQTVSYVAPRTYGIELQYRF